MSYTKLSPSYAQPSHAQPSHAQPSPPAPTMLTDQSVVGVVREESSEGEGQSDVGKVDKNEGCKRLEADGISEVSTIETVAAHDVTYQSTERPGGNWSKWYKGAY